MSMPTDERLKQDVAYTPDEAKDELCKAAVEAVELIGGGRCHSGAEGERCKCACHNESAPSILWRAVNIFKTYGRA